MDWLYYKYYKVKFEKNGVIKAKTYPFDYKIREINECSIIIIIYNKYIFFVKDVI